MVQITRISELMDVDRWATQCGMLASPCSGPVWRLAFLSSILSCSFGVVMIFHVSWHAGTPTINNIVAIHAITLRVWLILSKQSYYSLNHHYGTLSLLLLWEAKSVSSASLICRSAESAAPAPIALKASWRWHFMSATVSSEEKLKLLVELKLLLLIIPWSQE